MVRPAGAQLNRFPALPRCILARKTEIPMKKYAVLSSGLCLSLLIAAAWQPRVHGANTPGTRLLRTPTVSATQIAFAYANNIWVVERSGGIARRLTSFQGQTGNPHFSPDGRTIAFSAEYGGNTDVYVVSSEGGEPKRLTWHPGADTAQGWTPDGKSVLFASARATWAPSAAPRFWTVPASGGVEEPLPLPRR
jgi:tricorn protease